MNLQYYYTFIGTYIFWSFITFFLDLYSSWNKQSYFQKIKPKTSRETLILYKKIAPVVFYNVIIVSFPFSLSLPYLINLRDRQTIYTESFFDIILSTFAVDFFIYCAHRLLHFPYFYKYHKKHHELKEPIGLGALYVSTTDLYLGQLIPSILPSILLSSPPFTVHIWIFIAITNTILVSHTNYKYWSEFHDIHHSHFKYNYGVGGYTDKLMGTYKNIAYISDYSSK